MGEPTTTSQKAFLYSPNHSAALSFNAPQSYYTYIKELAAIPTLAPKEELYLARLSENGSPDEAEFAREILFECNLRLVAHLARDFVRSDCTIQDLISEGNIALRTAILKFDTSFGTKLSTHAAFWIKSAFRKALNSSNLIQIPKYQQSRICKINDCIRKHQAATGLTPSDTQIADITGFTPDQVVSLRNLNLAILPLRLPSTPDSPQLEEPAFPILPEHPQHHSNSKSPYDDLETKNTHEHLRSLLPKVLNPQELDVITLHFGLNHDDPLTLETIGEKYNLTKERIRQIETVALKKIKRRFTSESTHLAQFLAATDNDSSSPSSLL